MLVLARHEGEGIRVELPDGSFGWIVVTEIETGLTRPRIRLGLKFPRSIGLSRHELLPPEALLDAPVTLSPRT